jgi:hypothetical protein
MNIELRFTFDGSKVKILSLADGTCLIPQLNQRQPCRWAR